MNHRYPIAASLCLFILIQLCLPDAMAQMGDRQSRMAAIQAVEDVLFASDDASINAFITEKLSSTYIEQAGQEALHTQIKEMRSAVSGAGGLDLMMGDDGIHLIFSEGADATVVVALSNDDPSRIAQLRLLEPIAEEDLTPAQRLNNARNMRGKALEGIGAIRDDAGLMAFAEEHFSPALRDEMGQEQTLDLLQDIRRISGKAGAIMAGFTADGVEFKFRGSENGDVIFRLEESPPHQMAAIRLDTDVAPEMAEVPKLAPINWDNLTQRLKEEEEAGFSGIILVARDGEIVHHQAYGMADRESGRANTTETIFGIGSTPIDFTRASILMLMDEGKLSLSDPISRFFPNVPADRASMTINHLMTGASGLPNFHHLSTDENYDLSYISKEEALTRIFNQPLLFEPGTDKSHSHSAFVLLSAVIEEASGQSYPDFLRSRLFEPLGMRHTGFYGESDGFEAEQMAAGYGYEQASRPNIPLLWGETGWLMMGSGGMVSTPADFYTWIQAIDAGLVLSEEAQESYWFDGYGAGGSDRGFLFFYRTNPTDTFILSSNSHSGGDDSHSKAVAYALRDLFK